MAVRSETYFAMIPEWLLDADVSAQAIRLYCVLNRYANEKRMAHPSRKALSDRMGCTVKTVDRALKELVAVGALRINARFDEAGDRTSNGYQLMVNKSLGSDTDVPTCRDKDVATGGDTGVAGKQSQVETEPNESEKTLAPRRERDLLFEAVAEVCGLDWQNGLTTPARGALNAAVAHLRAIHASPADVRHRARNYAAIFPGATLTANALAKHWPQLGRARTPDRPKDRFADMAERLHQREGVDDERTNGSTGAPSRRLPA